MNGKYILIQMMFVGLLFAGCGGKIANNKLLEQQAQSSATSSNMSSEKAVEEAAKMVNKGNDQELSFYAPMHIKAAKEALKKAEKQMENPKYKVNVLKNAFKAKALIEDGFKVKASVLEILAKSFEYKKILDEIDSQREFPDIYKGMASDLKGLIKKIEEGKFNDAVDGQTDILKDMTIIEIKTMKKRHMSLAEAMLDKAEDGDADNYAKATYEKAEKQIETSNLFIEKNYRDRENVKKTGRDALMAATHAYNVGKESEQLLLIMEKSELAEQRVLYFESLLERIGLAMEEKNLQGMTMYEQSEYLSKKIEKLRNPKSIISQEGEEGVDIKKSEENKSVEKEESSELLKASDAKVTDEEVSDAKVTDEEVSDAKVTDGEASDAKVTDEEASDAKVTDEEVSDAKVTDEEVSDVKVTDGEVTDGEVTDGEVTDGEVTDSQKEKISESEKTEELVEPDPVNKDDNKEPVKPTLQTLEVPALKE